MAKFTVTFERRVVEFDRYTCDVEAESEAEATAKADAMANEFDRDCPDTETIRTECEDWYVNDLEELSGAELLRRRQDVASVAIMPDGTFATIDDTGDEFEGDYAATVAWLDAGQEGEESDA